MEINIQSTYTLLEEDYSKQILIEKYHYNDSNILL